MSKLNVKGDILKIMKAMNGSQVETKANEAHSESQSGYGGAWAPDEFANAVVKKARAQSNILSRLPSENIHEMRSKVWTSPVEGADPVFEAGSENANVPGTAVTTSKSDTPTVSITAKRYSASVYLSGELDEDAQNEGGLQAYLENKMASAYAELIEKALILSDSETGSTGNVNSDDAAPVAKSYYLHQDGMFKKAIVTDTKTVNAGTLDASDFTAARKQLGKYGLNPRDLLWILEPQTYFTVLDLSQVQTQNTFGSAATINAGVLEKLQGIDIMTNEAIGLADSDGKVNLGAGVAANTKGRGLLTHIPSIHFGFRRRLKISVKYLDEYDQFRITAHTRFGFCFAFSNTNAAIINVTV